MDSILKWTEEFRRDSKKPEEIVAFDILGGDFNLDNMSPGRKSFTSTPSFHYLYRHQWYNKIFNIFNIFNISFQLIRMRLVTNYSRNLLTLAESEKARITIGQKVTV